MRLLSFSLFAASLVFSASADYGCADTPKSASGLTAKPTSVSPGADGLTVEQRNVRDRLMMDNKPGSIKHLYVISSFSGQVLLYSTVKGKVTSSGKRLTPTMAGAYRSAGAFKVELPGGDYFYTTEVLQDDGTYGSSVEYLYWWDVQGRYHQHYVSGGQIVHISDQPIPVKSITINMEARSEQ